MSDAHMGPQTPDQTLRSPRKQETNQDEREVQAIMIGQPPKGDSSRIRPIHTARQQVQSRATAQAQSTAVKRGAHRKFDPLPALPYRTSKTPLKGLMNMFKPCWAGLEKEND